MTRNQLLALLTFGIAVLALGSGTVLASDLTQAETPILVDASAVPTEDGLVEVTMKFADAQGNAVIGEQVNFSLGIDFLGQKAVSLGSAKTDSSGLAKIIYTPNWDGAQHVAAKLGGSKYSPMETAIEFDVAGSKSAYHVELPALAIIRQWLPPVIGVVVLLVWGTIALVAVGTTYGIVTAGRRREMSEIRYPVGIGIAVQRPLARQPREQVRRRSRTP